jgi:hypothetical protein
MEFSAVRDCLSLDITELANNMDKEVNTFCKEINMSVPVHILRFVGREHGVLLLQF